MRQADLSAMFSPVRGAGERIEPGRPQPRLRGRTGHEAEGTRSRMLSAREVDILEELAMGTSTEEIAAKLHVSPHTVRTHIKNILRKLGARTRAHAVAIAYAENAIDPAVFPSDA